MRVSRDTLTVVKGSRLDILFSGRWDKELLLDKEGNVFFDIDPFYFKKVVEYLYRVKAHQEGSTADMSEEEHDLHAAVVKDMFVDNKEGRKVFDLYIDFFRLGPEEVKKERDHNTTSSGKKKKMPTPTISGPDASNQKQEEAKMPSYNDLLDAFKKEEKELKLVETKLDEMDSKIMNDETFVSYFTTEEKKETGNEGSDLSGDHKDDDSSISFASMTSDLNSDLSLSSSLYSSEEGEATNQRRYKNDYITTAKDSKQATTGAPVLVSCSNSSEILNLWVCGEVVPVKRSTIMCACNKGSYLVQNLNDVDWMKKHLLVCEDGTTLVRLDDHLPAAVMTMINQLRLQAMMMAVGRLEGKEEGPVKKMKMNTTAEERSEMKKLLSELFNGKEEEEEEEEEQHTTTHNNPQQHTTTHRNTQQKTTAHDNT